MGWITFGGISSVVSGGGAVGWEFAMVRFGLRMGSFALVISGLVILLAPMPALAVCGDGIVDANEECDPGGSAWCFGDPEQGACGPPNCATSDCFYELSCCKVNCQFVGDSDIACDDGNPCTGPDTCNQLGQCNAEQLPVANGTPCDDGQFCTATDTCQTGECTGSGSPCAETECNTCQEDSDSCFDPVETPCAQNDGNDCTTGTCNGSGTCNSTSVADETPCDDGLFCTETDTCQAGVCTGSGDPCPGTECNTCQEDTDSCFDPSGTACTDDGNACTDDECSGSGMCTHPNNTDTCDNGLFCDGADQCTGGTCESLGIDPCDDEVGCTEDTCDDEADACTNTPQDSLCDDGAFCNGAESCDAALDCQAGTDPCVDGNACTVDDCDEGGDSCIFDPLPELASCEDGDFCTLDDQCIGGACVGQTPLLADLCPWVLIATDVKKDKIKTGRATDVLGDICAKKLIIGQASTNDSTIVADEASSPSAIKFGQDAIVDDDIVTAGGGVKGKSQISLPALVEGKLAPGSLVAKLDASGFYDLTGTHGFVVDCQAARGAFDAAATAIEGLSSTQSLGVVKLKSGQPQTFTADTPGGVSVIDIDKLVAGRDVVLTFDGAGDSGSVIVVRVAGLMKIASRATIEATNGLLPENLLIYVAGKKCQVGDKAEGVGTLLCAGGKVSLGDNSDWVGTLMAGRKSLKVGEATAVTYSPFQGF